MKLFKTKYLYAACIALMGIGTTGCEDMLDKEPPASISDGNFWNDENDAFLALTACYQFATGWNNDSFDGPQGLMYLDLCGGHGAEKEGFTTDMASAHTTATNGNVRSFWSNAYGQIATQNTFLDNVVACPMDETTKAQMIAEVKVLRAYYFFNLAFYFQNIPMPLKTLTVEEANSIEQTPQAEVYAQVEKDCKEAISALPEKQTGSAYGRVNKGVARAILGRLYLAQNKWSEAAAIYKDIISSGVYKLYRDGVDNYGNLFRLGAEYSEEPIFFAMNMKDKHNNVHTIYKTPERMGGWHQFAINNELVRDYFCIDGKSIDESPLYDENDPYLNRDPRLYSTIFLPPLGSYPGTKYKNQTYDCYEGAGTADFYSKYPRFNGYAPYKALDENMDDIWGNYVYTPFIRYGEVLLSYIEAVNESAPGSVDQAMIDLTINDIRNRAGIPGIQKADFASQEKMRQAIRHERRVELALEGLRYFDILRWGIADKELNHYFTGVKLSRNPADRNYDSKSPVDANGYYQYEKRSWDAHNRYFPIPQSDMNVNKNLKQNQGYN